MMELAEPYKSAYLGGRPMIVAFTKQQDAPPTVGSSGLIAVATNDGLLDSAFSPYEALTPGKITQLSYEMGCNGVGIGSVMTPSLNMNVTKLLSSGRGTALWLGFSESGDWKDPYNVTLWKKMTDVFKTERPIVTQNRFVDIKAYGYLQAFDKPITSASTSGLTFKQMLNKLMPCTIPVYFEKLCEGVGYTVDDDSAMVNNTQQITTSPFGNSSENITCRDVLEWLLEITGTYLSLVPDGSGYKLKCYALSTSNVKPLTNIAKMDVHVLDTFIKSVKVKGDDWSLSRSATTSTAVEERQIEISANPLYDCLSSENNRTSAATAVVSKYLGKIFTEFDISVAAGWQYEVGDYVSFTDAKGKTRKGWLTYVKHTMGGLTELKCELAS